MLNKKPVTGMKDIMPDEAALRAYVMQIIRDTYMSRGFSMIETPCMENIANLSNKQGGENEKLIFKVLKRGEKLNIKDAVTDEDVVDFGMRYDLTVPLVRYYSNNADKLPSPFKSLQMGNVWRADRPQRGRYRQFMQCDIDIIGEPSNLAETELIGAACAALGRLSFSGFEIRINDRRILKAMALFCGFDEKDTNEIFITLDKMDKIGKDGVKEELIRSGCPVESTEKYMSLFDELSGKKTVSSAMEYLSEVLKDYAGEDVFEHMTQIEAGVNAAKEADFELIFDPSLVRGMSYYTGTIFEINMPEFSSSCGGGGRYDRMVGNFTGNDVPACGISIGFERIVLLLIESGFKIPGESRKKAYLIDKKYPAEKLPEIFKKAKEERQKGVTVLIGRMNKNKKFQKEKLKEAGYEEFEEFFK